MSFQKVSWFLCFPKYQPGILDPQAKVLQRKGFSWFQSAQWTKEWGVGGAAGAALWFWGAVSQPLGNAGPFHWNCWELEPSRNTTPLMGR